MIWTIAVREILTRVRTKPFQILTGLLFLGVIAVGFASSFFVGGEDEAREVTIGIIGDGGEFAGVLGVANDSISPTIVMNSSDADLLDGDVDVLFDGSSLTWTGFPDPDIDVFIRTSVQQAEFVNRAGELDLSPTDLGALFAEVEIGEERLDGSEDEQGIRIATAAASTLGMFFVLQIWGAFLMMGVVEEKSSRVVEVLLSHVEARTLLAGKILGLGLLALFQMLILIAGIIVGLSFASDIEIPDGVWSAVPVLLLMFIFGYAFYASLFAAVGSTVSRQEDAQTAQLPAMLPLFVGYLIAFSSIGNPDSIAVRIASFVPFTAPTVMPFRVAMSDPPIWEIGLSLALLAVSVPLMLRLAGSIYRTSLLKVGTRIPLKEAIRNRGEV